MEILYRKPDGSYVASVNGMPYHVVQTDPLFDADLADTAALRPDGEYEMNDSGQWVAITVQPTAKDVNMERARRIEAGTDLSVPGLSATVALQMREQDEFNILGLAQMAQLRIASSDTTAFNFRDRENVVHSVSPTQMLSLAILAATFKSSIIEASWVIKALDPIPADFAHDMHWS